MKIYLVGGAVRDQLLQLPCEDQDWLVVGATAKQMLAQGFRTVGQDFPVFLHPQSQQEYALARTEKKTGTGYGGFDCYFDIDVTVEQDLLRRDLTINAMARDQDGQLIDPYGGQADLNAKTLRHVSPAFVEDPLRVLRVARFAARFADMGFTVATETLQLMQQIVEQGELNTLTPERIWLEWHKSLQTNRPDVFLSTLRQCGALAVILPELDDLFSVPQSARAHPEGDAGTHTLLVSQQAAQLTDNLPARFAAQLHDLGKALTHADDLPKHPGHAQAGQPIVEEVCRRLKVPNDFRTLAQLVCGHHIHIHCIRELTANEVLDLFDALDVWRKPDRIDQILICCQADHLGRANVTQLDYPQAAYFYAYFQACSQVQVQDIIAQGYRGAQIKQALAQARIAAIEQTHLP